MTQEQQIDQQIQKEFDSFNNAKYDSDPLPKDFIERFKKAVFKLPVKAHQLSCDTISKIVAKKVKDLTNLDVPVIINAVQLLPMCDLYDSLEEALVKTKEIEEIKIGYNIMVQKLNHAMSEKRQTLLNLSGVKPPLKLVSAQA